MESNLTTSSVAYSRYVTASHVMNWIIEEFDTTCPKESDGFDEIRSPPFELTLPNGRVTKWCAKALGGDQWLQLYILFTNATDLEPSEGVMCKYVLSIGTPEEPEIKSRQGSKTFLRNDVGRGRGWPKFLQITALYDRGLIRDGKLHVRVKVEARAISSGSVQVPSAASFVPVGNNAKRLRIDPEITYDCFLKDPTYSDVVLKCGPQAYAAHKIHLAARSSVFAAMFKTGMKEAASGTVEIQDMQPETLKVILDYIYSGNVDEPEPDALLEIVHGAEKYGLKGLKDFCFTRLVRCITLENAGPLAVAAHLYGAEEAIREAVWKYLQPNFGRLMLQPNFRQLVKQYGDAFAPPE